MTWEGIFRLEKKEKGRERERERERGGERKTPDRDV